MIRPRSKPRPGRLKGEALQQLRMDCWFRDKGECQKCGIHTNYVADPMVSYSYHMSHIQAKRLGGDSLDNVETLCGDCHRKYHNYGPTMEKPCPPKSRNL